ncbi:DUF1501 domain-containing protein [Roseiterribacter gracilis]|uniref:DUF1501 domain-containing protein n=1 Tax=Roseiterribacter gracilis TaxID=2812848 RepID=A0A8S8XEN8_9PROT|nr:hypothetical protein TMPK1_26180 [Rhodospirillales bacterium TMPK1]
MTDILIARRSLLLGAAAVTLAAGTSRLALAAADTDRRFVFVLLRGGMDGLAAVAPYGDNDYARLRGSLALAKPGEADGALDLDGFFALHPSLAPIHSWFKEGALLPVHAVATSYRDRSHFDAQDLLENGTKAPHAASDGWLNRTLSLLPGAGERRLGLAVGQQVPLVLRGPVQVASWAPSNIPAAQPGFLDLVREIYKGDKLFSTALANGIAASDGASSALGDDMKTMGKPPANGAPRPAAAVTLATAAGKMLAEANGPRIAVLELGGWDTHAGQGAARGRFAGAATALADSLVALRTSLGPAWQDTVIAVATEFGRTAAVNGTGGTDHGTAGAAFLAGGAVAGGRVAGKWPGLAADKLYQARDLAPTTDLRAVLKGALRDHLRLPTAKLDTAVFKDSSDAPPLAGLIRV